MEINKSNEGYCCGVLDGQQTLTEYDPSMSFDDDGVLSEAVRPVLWRINPDSGSIYEDALFIPLVARAKHLKTRGRNWASSQVLGSYGTFILLLMVNHVIQGFGCFMVHKITEREQSQFKKNMFRMCSQNQVRDLRQVYPGIIPEVIDNSTRVFECTAASTVMFHRPGSLDLNGDGIWTRAEASQLQLHVWKYRLVHLTAIFENLYRNVEDISRFQHSSSSPLVANGSGIRMSWLNEHQKMFKICTVADTNMCGVLERDGILLAIFPGIDHQDMRITKCEDVMESFCRPILGERFKWYVQKTHQYCGEPDYEWDDDRQLRVVTYAKSQAYALEEGSISSLTYALFLSLMLAIWYIAVVTAFESFVMFCKLETVDANSVHVDHWITREDKVWHVHKVPIRHHVFAMTLIYVPRLVIGLALFFVGSTFLLTADDYIDLLLNSTALALLLEVDNIIHRALVSPYYTAIVSSCAPLEREASTAPERFYSKRYAAIYIALGFAYISGRILYAYFHQEGKLALAAALQCLCEFSGPSCFGRLLVNARQ